MSEEMKCPKCGSDDLWRESADVGVGVIYGPYGCPGCGWSEQSEYDRSNGPAEADKEGECIHDQWGMGMPVRSLREDV